MRTYGIALLTLSLITSTLVGCEKPESKQSEAAKSAAKSAVKGPAKKPAAKKPVAKTKAAPKPPAKKKVAAPACWRDLVKPEFAGEVQMANPNASGTAYTAIATLVQVFGEEEAFKYLKALHRNVNSYPRSGVGPIKAVGRLTRVKDRFGHSAAADSPERPARRPQGGVGSPRVQGGLERLFPEAALAEVAAQRGLPQVQPDAVVRQLPGRGRDGDFE